MKHAMLKARVAEAEQRLAQHLGQADLQMTRLHNDVRASITPARVLGAGMLTGFVLGWLRPGRSAVKGLELMRLLRLAPGWLAVLEPWLAALRQEGGGRGSGRS